MALFVYVTEKCRDDANRHGQLKNVEKFRQRLFEEQRLSLMDSYPHPFFKKRFSSFRLIAEERQVNDHQVMVFCRLLKRGGSGYDSFKNNPQKYGEENFTTLVDNETLRKWLEEQATEVTPQKQQLTDAEKRYLWDVRSIDYEEGEGEFIYESKDWVKHILREDIQLHLEDICATISQLDDQLPETTYKTIPVKNTGLNIIYRAFQKYGKFFLAGIVKSTSQDAQIIVENYRPVLHGPATEEDILRASIRTYPIVITAEKDSWIAIQKDEASNLALSPEEAELLNSVYQFRRERLHLAPGAKRPKLGFPLFINGRAGSGKSTILQYMFAPYVSLYLNQPEADYGPPLFLTYSDKLVNRGKRVIRSLLNSSSQKKMNSADQIDEIQEKKLETCFLQFRKFLLQFVDQNTRYEHFPEDNYMSYSRFMELWKKKFDQVPEIRKKCSPEISWHIIRSFIKGRSVDYHLEQEEYSQLPKAEQSVSKEVFDFVYERIWEGWYTKECGGFSNELQPQYWDDQDLLRYLLDNNLIEARHPAIFCDEAQDFTSIELDAILRSSLFFNRQITRQELERVPFAFAGDPLQTLNPTGFRWENIKGIFIEKFIHSLSYNKEGGQQNQNFRELSFNYRSSENIVKFSNSIQAIRTLLFGYKDLEPQISWQYETEPPIPVFFDINDPKTLHNLSLQKELTIVVPCNLGEEVEFVKNDQFLKQFVTIKDDVALNVFSASRIKGLEYQRVAIYGFSKAQPEKLPKLLAEFYEETDRDSRLSLEYFINKLYVAVSRPKRKLIIIDDAQSLETLWAFALKPERIAALKSKIGLLGKQWDDKLGLMTMGIQDNWDDDKEDYVDKARSYERDGLERQDPHLLKQAAMLYSVINFDREKIHLCEAKAAELEGKHLQAAQYYEEANEINHAFDMYWAARQYEEAYRLIMEEGTFFSESDIRRMYVIFHESPGVKGFLDIINIFMQSMDAEAPYLSVDKNWAFAFNKGIDLLLETFHNLDEETWMNLAARLKLLNIEGVKIDLGKLALLHYKSGLYEDAIQLWDQTDHPYQQEYKDANLQILIKKHKEGALKDFSKEHKEYLAKHYFKAKQWLNAAEVYHQLNLSHKIAAVINGYCSSKTRTEELDKLLQLFLSALCNKNDWKKAKTFVSTGTHKYLIEKGQRAALQEIQDESNNIFWVQQLIYEMAHSKDLAQQPHNIRKDIAEYLLKKAENGITQYLNPKVLGTAIEKTGMYKAANSYYERLAEKTTNEETRRFAKTRWIKVRLKQADYEDLSKNIAAADRIRKKALERAELLKIDVSQITEYPNTNDIPKPVKSTQKKIYQAPELKIPGTAEPRESRDGYSPGSVPSSSGLPEKEELSLLDLEISITRKGRFILIKNKKTFESAKVQINSPLQIKSFDVKCQDKKGVKYIPEWNVTIQEQPSNHGTTIRFYFEEKGIGLDVEI